LSSKLFLTVLASHPFAIPSAALDYRENGKADFKMCSVLFLFLHLWYWYCFYWCHSFTTFPLWFPCVRIMVRA
jgi:hypothetical protein